MGRKHRNKKKKEGDTGQGSSSESLEGASAAQEPCAKKSRLDSGETSSEVLAAAAAASVPEERATIEEFCEAVKNGVGVMGDNKPSLFLLAPLGVGQDPNKPRNPHKAVDLRQTLFWVTGACTTKPKHVKVGSRKACKLPPEFSTIVVVTCTSLTEHLYRAVGGDDRIEEMRTVFGDDSPIVPFKAPGSKNMVYNLFETVLRDGSTLPGCDPHQDIREGGRLETWDDLVISDAEYAAAYPFPSKDVSLFTYKYDILESHERSEEMGPEDPKRHVIALDCEMVETIFGLEIARVSVVDMEGSLLLDTTVLPTHEVTNYLTEFSGITKEILDETKTTLEEVRSKLLEQFIFKDTVLVGHGLENDLQKLHIAHRKVVDTALLYGRLSGGKYKLRELTRHFLHRDIQIAGHSHDSTEDAIACLDLVKLRLKNGRVWTNSQLNFNPRKDPAPSEGSSSAPDTPPPKPLSSLFTEMADKGLNCTIFEGVDFQMIYIPVLYQRNEHIKAYPTSSDIQTVGSVKQGMSKVPLPHLFWARFDMLEFRAREIETAQNKLGIGKADSREEALAMESYVNGLHCAGDYLKRIYESMPDNSLLILIGTDPSTKILRQAKYACQHGQSSEEWTPALEKLFMQRVEEARSLFVRFKVKLPKSASK